MKNAEQWRPSKFVYVKGRLKPSGKREEVNISSRLIAGIIAAFYDEHLKIHVRGKLLDLGCGKAPLYEAYKGFADEVVCVDWPNSLHKNPHLDHEMDLNQPLQFADNSFDTIILSDVLEHIRKPDLLLAEIFRILAPGGKLIMNVPFYYWLHEEPFDYYRYTKFALKAMGEDAGFNIIKLEAIGGAPEILTDIISKIIIKMPVLGPLAARVIQKTTQLFLRLSLGRKLSTKTSEKFPLGYVMIAGKIK